MASISSFERCRKISYAFMPAGADTIQLPVTTLDRFVEKHGLDRIRRFYEDISTRFARHETTIVKRSRRISSPAATA